MYINLFLLILGRYLGVGFVDHMPSLYLISKKLSNCFQSSCPWTSTDDWLVPTTSMSQLPPVSVAFCTILLRLTPAVAPTQCVSKGAVNEAELSLSLCGLLRLMPQGKWLIRIPRAPKIFAAVPDFDSAIKIQIFSGAKNQVLTSPKCFTPSPPEDPTETNELLSQCKGHWQRLWVLLSAPTFQQMAKSNNSNPNNWHWES